MDHGPGSDSGQIRSRFGVRFGPDMGEKYVQESDQRIWVKNVFRNLVLDFGLLD